MDDDSTGTLIYGHYGTSQDFEFLQRTRIPLNGSIALVRFGPLHPSKVVSPFCLLISIHSMRYDGSKAAFIYLSLFLIIYS